jgi:hypothetical protein
MFINTLATLLAKLLCEAALEILRSQLLGRKLIIKDHQLRIRKMLTTCYFISRAVLTKVKVNLVKDYYESDSGKGMWIEVL